MERKDAVYWLNNLIGNYSNYYDDALEMGVKALEQQEIVHCCECVYRHVEGKKVRFNRCKLDHNSVQSDDWYCADGIRRADDRQKNCL